MIFSKVNDFGKNRKNGQKTPILAHFWPFCPNFERPYLGEFWELRAEIFKVDAKGAKVNNYNSFKSLNKFFWAPQAKNRKKAHFRHFDGLS